MNDEDDLAQALVFDVQVQLAREVARGQDVHHAGEVAGARWNRGQVGVLRTEAATEVSAFADAADPDRPAGVVLEREHDELAGAGRRPGDLALGLGRLDTRPGNGRRHPGDIGGQGQQAGPGNVTAPRKAACHDIYLTGERRA